MTLRIYVALMAIALFGGCLLPVEQDSDAEWRTVKPASGGLTAIHFPDADTGYAAGSGKIFKTVNGGRTWGSYDLGVSESVYSTFFLNGSVGYAGATKGMLLKTVDGAASWSVLRDSAWGDTAGLRYSLIPGMHFRGDTGFVLLNRGGEGGRILKTVNGGVSWKIVHISLNVEDGPFSIQFTDAATGYVAAREGVYKTTGGGETWTLRPTGSARGHTGLAVAGGVLCVSGRDGIFRSTDGGQTWNHVFASGDLFTLNAIAFLDDMNGYAVGERILRTSDGGATWQESGFKVSPDALYMLYALSCPDAHACYASAGYGRVLVHRR